MLKLIKILTGTLEDEPAAPKVEEFATTKVEETTAPSKFVPFLLINTPPSENKSASPKVEKPIMVSTSTPFLLIEPPKNSTHYIMLNEFSVTQFELPESIESSYFNSPTPNNTQGEISQVSIIDELETPTQTSKDLVPSLKEATKQSSKEANDAKLKAFLIKIDANTNHQYFTREKGLMNEVIQWNFKDLTLKIPKTDFALFVENNRMFSKNSQENISKQLILHSTKYSENNAPLPNEETLLLSGDNSNLEEAP